MRISQLRAALCRLSPSLTNAFIIISTLLISASLARAATIVVPAGGDVQATINAAAPGDPANPNGSLRAIAGVLNKAGNVAGLMPHPERAAEAILGSDDGMGIVRSLVDSAARAGAASRGAPVEVGAR